MKRRCRKTEKCEAPKEINLGGLERGMRIDFDPESPVHGIHAVLQKESERARAEGINIQGLYKEIVAGPRPDPPDWRYEVLRINEHLPHDIDAERMLLGILLKDLSCFAEVRESMCAEDLYAFEHIFIFRAIEAVAQQDADWSDVYGELLQRETISKAGGELYLTSLYESAETADAERVVELARAVRHFSIERWIVRSCMAFMGVAADLRCTPESVLDWMQREVGVARWKLTKTGPAEPLVSCLDAAAEAVASGLN